MPLAGDQAAVRRCSKKPAAGLTTHTKAEIKGIAINKETFPEISSNQLYPYTGSPLMRFGCNSL
jgi:hypothetical protein